MPIDETMRLADTVPIAAPRVPNAGTGPRPGIRMTLNATFSTVIRIPRRKRRARITGRSQRPAKHEEQQHADAEDEHRPQERQGLALHLGRRVHQIEEGRRQHIAERRQDDERQDDGGQERLVNRPVDLFWLVRAGEPRDEHAHPREERGDEDDDDEEDLPADADGGVAGKADVVADHHVVDDALQTTDRVLAAPSATPSSRPRGAIGPSTSDRSSLRAADVPGGAAADWTGAPGVMSVIDPVAASAADDAEGGGVEADTSRR